MAEDGRISILSSLNTAAKCPTDHKWREAGVNSNREHRCHQSSKSPCSFDSCSQVLTLTTLEGAAAAALFESNKFAMTLGFACDALLCLERQENEVICIQHATANANAKTRFMQATKEVISRVPLSTEAEFNEAVKAAKSAFPAWSQSAVGTRARVMFKLQQLIWENKVYLL